MDDDRPYSERHARHRGWAPLRAAVTRLGLAVVTAVLSMMVVLVAGWAVTTFW